MTRDGIIGGNIKYQTCHTHYSKATLKSTANFEIVTSYCQLRSSIYHFRPPLPRLFKHLNLFLPSGFKMASFQVGLDQTFLLRYAYKVALGQSSSQLPQLLRRSKAPPVSLDPQISHVPARILHSVGSVDHQIPVISLSHTTKHAPMINSIRHVRLSRSR